MSFKRIAIVNRGEAAMRCIRAVKALRTLEREPLDAIALYTDGDRDAPFVRHADHALLLESPNGAVAAYLDHDLLIEALRATNADAVWPGWGFVAEDAEFVERLRSEGIVFLGPSPEAMRAVGDKIAAKQLAEKAQVPVSKWNGGVLADVDDARHAAEEVGYPRVIKAAAGGGGRGIRMVEGPDELEAAFDSAGSEALAAFGDGRLFCEERVVGGRHIEVQIAADLEGFAVALGSRDCSVQRRHQKVLEEAPPPGMSQELRSEIEASAVRLAREVGYAGVGTVEFLVVGDHFVFLEVNPRLQVEHGITEELIGLDLVQLQIRIARGESLSKLEIVERGASIEARVCAEDPDHGFVPSPGRIACFNPLVGSGVRVDTGVATGTTVPADFDSLIAKVIATGETRDEARAKLACALRDFELVVEGGATNKGYLLELLDSEDYREGGVDTSWLDRWSAERELSHDDADIALVAAAVLAYQRGRGLSRLNFYSDPTSLSAERVPPSIGQQLDLSYGHDSYRLEVYAIGSWRYRVHLDGRVVTAAMREEGSHSARLVIDDRVHRVLYDATEVGLRVELDGHPHRFGWQTLGQVRSSTPAMVVAVHVDPGDRVEVGQSLGLVEAMKMEIGFEAPVSGIVSEVTARKGQKVAAGDLLLVIDPGTDDESAGNGAVRLKLPLQTDPLALLFAASEGGVQGELGAPDLSAALAADVRARRAAIGTVRDEVRRVLLGFDANPTRGRQLIEFLEEPLPAELPADLVRGLAALRRELLSFVNLERLFIRAPRASVSGELGPSNNARLRVYLRRLRASGAGIAEEFLDLLRAALSDYGVPNLDPTDALERAVLRMLASQVEPGLRRDLVQALIGMLTRLATRVDLTHDAKLEGALSAISGMRGLVADSLADAAIDARYAIFEGPRMEKRIEPTSQELEAWLSLAESRPTLPADAVLYELAVAPHTIFQRVGRWLDSPEPARRDIALAAHLQRRYAGDAPLDRGALVGDGANMQWTRVPERGVVLARVCGTKDAESSALALIEASQEWENSSDTLLALELVVPRVELDEVDEIVSGISELLATQRQAHRFTLELHTEDGNVICRTYESMRNAMEIDQSLHDVHPEIAHRIDLQRYSAFELERIPGEEGIYTFHGRALEVPDDERIFVLADVPGRFPHAGREVEPYLANFERAFHRATSRLRGVLQERDPRRKLHWNRIVLHVGAAIHLDSEVAAELGQRLAPATRHLGLEKLLVGLNVYDRDQPEQQPQPIELVFADPTGHAIEIKWRKPHTAPLHLAHSYERRVVSARSRRLVYPYEIIRMLTSADGTSANGDRGDDTRDEERVPLPRGTFEEYDIVESAGSSVPKAQPVSDRKYGLNEASVVFGVISTPTPKFEEGIRRVLILSDPTIGMGSLAGPECDRIVAAIDLAERESIPLEWVPVSSGAKIAMDSGTENLDATARVVRRIVTFTQAGGEIHVIVQGVNVGAQSYFDALATMLMHTRGVLIMTPGASMVLTGRAALEASGAVSAEDEIAIGGFERIMGPNGEAQYYARNLADAYRTLYDYYNVSYVSPGETGPRRAPTDDPASRSICDFELDGPEAQGFSSVGEIFDDEANPGRKKPFPMRAIMQSVIDTDSGHVERWRQMQGAQTSVVWDSHLGGIPITLIGIESHTIERDGYRPLDGPESWSGGTLFPRSSKKVARAINAASGNRPVVILANLSGFDGSPESLRKLQLEYGAEIARAVVNFDGPILFLVVSRYHGGAYVVFSQELNDGLRASALTGSYASVIGGSAAASVVFARDVQARALSDQRVVAARLALRLRRSTEARAEYEKILDDVTLEHQAALAEEFDEIHSVERAREVGSLDAIFDAAQMRPTLIQQLEAALRD
ncbi:MAG: biotin carboxylase N-terminal domain-containing protein [Myxococcota bacterium]|nr:biotin carboxylase N-terminal domain-containing protein [Myxococcota bacterium]